MLLGYIDRELDFIRIVILSNRVKKTKELGCVYKGTVKFKLVIQRKEDLKQMRKCEEVLGVVRS